MATGSNNKRKRSAGYSGANNRKNAGRNPAGRSSSRNTGKDGLNNEIILITVIAFSVLLFLGNLGVIGSFGDHISKILYGLFGFVSFLVPVALILAAFAYTLGKGSSITSVKLWSGAVLVVILCALSQLWFYPDNERTNKISEYYDKCYELKRGGGIIGGFIESTLIKGVGNIGTNIVLIVLALICIILITEKSFIGGVRMGGKTLYDNAKNDIIRRRERRENERPLREESRRLRQEEKETRRLEEERLRKIRVEERNEKLRRRDMERLEKRREAERIREENLRKKEEGLRRMDRKVSGVMMDTELRSKDAKPSEENIKSDIHEISYTHDENNAQKVIDENDRYNDGEIKELYADTRKNEYRLGYENARSSHTISVDTSKMVKKPVFDVYDRKKLGDTAEFENAIINETLHLANEYEYESKITADVFEPDIASGDDEEEYKYSGSMTSIDEYMKPSVTVNEGSYDNSQKTQAGKETKHSRAAKHQVKEFKFPPVSLLKKGSPRSTGDSKHILDEKAARLKETLKEFGVGVTMTGYTQGPAITRFEMKPDVGVKVSKVLNLSDDIMLSMAAKNVRIEAPIPGKSLIGIELPNEETMAVMFRDLIDSHEFKKSESKLSFAVGKGLSGETVVADIGKMPHLLIAGATGSGKSVCINTLIMSILYKARPDEVKLIMIDPKVVELSVYNGIPHLMIPVVTDPKQAAEALKWGVVEMDDRYNKFAEFGVRDLNGYNKKVQSMTDVPDQDRYTVLPRIIIIVDELADLMMVASKEVEESICRIAQKARAAGIHLVIATQRPSVDVVTGLIKANMPSRIAFSVSSGVDSRTILDMVGAEKLLGKGDMLFYPQGYTKPARVQGAFVSDQEVNDVVDFLKEHSGGDGYDDEIAEKIKSVSVTASGSQDAGNAAAGAGNGRDELFVEAARAIIDKNKASIGMLQRLFKIGFNRAARIMDQLADAGVVGEEEGTKPRKVLMSMEQLEAYIEDYL